MNVKCRTNLHALVAGSGQGGGARGGRGSRDWGINREAAVLRTGRALLKAPALLIEAAVALGGIAERHAKMEKPKH